MLRQASSRNQRAKGFNLKHALQICVLVAICIWLLYQVKHSHDKKKVFQERISNVINKLDESQPEIFRINRKDLPQTVEMDTGNEVHNEEEENEEFAEAEQETKQEETEDDEGIGDGNEETDEQDQERADEEAERGEFFDEEDNDGEAGELDLVEKEDEEEDQDLGSQEAREKSFKGDDASSAVLEGAQKLDLESDGETRGLDKEKAENMEGKEVETEGDPRSLNEEKVENMERKEEVTETTDNMMNETPDSSKDNDSSVQNVVDGSKGADSNIASGEKEAIPIGTGVETTDLEDMSMSNSTLGESKDQFRQQIDLPSTVSNDRTEQGTNSTTTAPSDQIGEQNSTMVITMVTNVVTLQNKSAGLDSVLDRNDTVEMKSHGGDASNSDNVLVDQGQHSNATTTPEESNENSATSSAEHEGGNNIAQGEASDTSHNLLTEEEKEVHSDLSILPGDQNEVKSVEEVAAE